MFMALPDDKTYREETNSRGRIQRGPARSAHRAHGGAPPRQVESRSRKNDAVREPETPMASHAVVDDSKLATISN